jgi:hypothetical protein
MEAAFGGFFAMLGIFIAIMSLAVYVVYSVLMMKMFKKFGVDGWKAWVPFVNTWTFLELGGQHGWWQFVPVANFIILIIAAYNIGLKFGKGGGFVVLYMFMPIVWMIIMALKSTTLAGSPSGEISVGSLGVTPEQTVFAKPNEPVAPAPVDGADVVSTASSTPSTTEDVASEATDSSNGDASQQQ